MNPEKDHSRPVFPPRGVCECYPNAPAAAYRSRVLNQVTRWGPSLGYIYNKWSFPFPLHRARLVYHHIPWMLLKNKRTAVAVRLFYFLIGFLFGFLIGF